MPPSPPPSGPSPLLRYVVAIDVIGGVAASAFLLLPGTATPFRLSWLDGPALVLALLFITALGDFAVVRLRHGDTVEDLGFLEAAVVVDAMLLPGHVALLVLLAGHLAVAVIRRRSPVKVAYNLGTYAAAGAVAIAVTGSLAGPAATFRPMIALALLLGTASFSAVNTVCLAGIMAVTGTQPARVFLRDEARLSLYMAVGTCALAAITLGLAVDGPVMLPFALMPAAALTYAYQAAAQESEERDRAVHLLTISRVLAAGGDILPSFLPAVRGAFDVDRALVTLRGSGVTVAVDRERPQTLVPVTSLPVALGNAIAPQLITTGLPAGWSAALAAPLLAEGERLGTLVLLTGAGRRTTLNARALTLGTSLASALAAALRGADIVDRLRAERTKLASVVEQATDGILVLGADGVVELWSPALETQTGVPAAAALGRRLGAVIRLAGEDGAELDITLTTLAPQQHVTGRLERADGTVRLLRCAHSGAFADDGTLVRDVVIVHDLTREQRVDRLKADFIAVVSHELRTPLTPIAGYLDLLRTRGDRVTPAKRDSILDLLIERTAHLARLVEDLLLASRIEDNGTAPTQDVTMAIHDLGALAAAAVSDTTSDRVRFVPPAEPMPVAGDGTRIRQILGNLVGNALKFSGPATPVDVVARAVPGGAEVEVRDAGVGIPAEELQMVFEKFHRVEDPMTMSTGGSGLGLYIARCLARAMGGDVTVTSTVGRGSTFTLRLDAPPAVGAPVPTPRALSAPRHTVGR